MDTPRLSPELLAHMTLRLRHAVSNGEYITVEILEQAMASFREKLEAAERAA
jgi:hypothetical protein